MKIDPELRVKRKVMADERRALREMQERARSDAAWLRERAIDKIISSDIDLSAHRDAVAAVLEAKPGEDVELPERPVTT